MRCSIGVVTFNGWEHTRACLEAVERDLPSDASITVVDNASTDGTQARIRAQFPGVDLIELGCNQGFAGGANLAIERTESEIVLLLNSDVVIQPEFISSMLAPFERSNDIGAVAGTLVYQRQPDVVASAGIEVYRNGLALDNAVGWRRSEMTDQPIFGASGGAVAYRRAALHDVGLFPSAFFMYLEDVDLAWRLRLRGWDAVLAAGAVATHAISASSGEGSAFKRRLLARNRVWTIVRCVPSWMLAHYGWRFARYDGAVMASAPARRDWESARGRIEALGALRARLAERRAIQSSVTVNRSEIESWLRPEPTASALRRLRKRSRQLAAD